MRTLFVTLAAALSALVLAGAAVATGHDGTVAVSSPDDVSSDVATDTTTLTDTTAAMAPDATATASDDTETEQTQKAPVTDDAAEDASLTSGSQSETQENDGNFGQARSQQVRDARAAGEQPGPAWQHPDHPTGGPQGHQTHDSSTEEQSGDAESSDDTDDDELDDDA